MKRKITHYLLATIVFVASFAVSNAQSGAGEIRGKVIDGSNNSPIYGAYVHLAKSGIKVETVLSDFDGNYYFKGLDPGDYDIVATAKILGYDSLKLSGIQVNSGQAQIVDLKMSKGGSTRTKVVVVKTYKDPLLKPDESTRTFNNAALTKMADRSINNIVGLTGGVKVTTNGGISFRGSRTDATAYYVDGVRVIGSFNTPQAAQDQISVIQGGVPAMLGDFTGGAVNITTRGPSRNWVRSLEVISSSLTDPYHYNQVEGFISGPLAIKDKGNRQKERVLMGFMLAGNIRYIKDRSPSAIGVFKVKDDIAAEIGENPLVRNGGSLVHAGNFLTKDDLENVKARPNSPSLNGVVQGRLQFEPKKGATITAFGSYFLFNGRSVTNNILNIEKTPTSEQSTIRTYLSFKQKLAGKLKKGEEQNKATLKNAFYTVRLDYQSSNSKSYDSDHKDDVFNYGYIGRFQSFDREAFAYRNYDQARRIIDQNGDTLFVKSYFDHVGYTDTAIRFNATGHNPFRANYTRNVFNQTAESGGRISSDLQIQALGGLLNGNNALNLYSIYQTPGFITSGFNQSQNERYTVYAMGEAQLLGAPKEAVKGKKRKERVPHDLQFGLQYEQTITRSYGLAASNLWTLMPQLVDRHLDLDLANPIASYDANGVFQDTIRYKTLVDESQQSTFDKNFRAKLIRDGAVDEYGNPITKETRLDINSYSPEDFDISMFSADELLNNGNAVVSYYGYDYQGKKVKGKPSIQDFLNDPANRTIGAFQPIYTAAWIQDKFVFRDLILRLGLRLERYDANQPVLKDPYSLYPIKTAGEVKDLNGDVVSHPDNIGKDYKVYVNDIDAPTKILGYRDGDQWYGADGTELNNARPLEEESSSNNITPYLVDPNNQQITSESFEDFTPKIQVLPRLWFSFPINDEALFFASYDVLTQRPSQGLSRFQIDDYYYMEEKSNSIFSNPSLKSRLKTDYEIGFKKQLSDISAVSLIASYSEIRNDINQFKFNYAYPVTEGYISYSNIDFSTNKGFRVEYDNRGRNHLSFNTNYTLQFADGTGASAGSQSALIQAGINNLRNTLPLGQLDIRHSIKAVVTADFPEFTRRGKKIKYDGPKIGKWEVLKNVTANTVFTANSGLPYTKIAKPLQIGTVERSVIVGQPYSSRLPWQFTMNINVSKAYFVNIGKTKQADGRIVDKRASLTAFFWVTNVLNLKNVNGVYAYTGNAEDDGFLNSPQGQLVVENAINAQSFYDLYSTAINNPGNFTAPRQARLGLRLNF